MNRHALWSFVLLLAFGSFLGCSRTSRISSDVSGSSLADREAAQNRKDLLKPSPCIKWENGSARSMKPPRKAKGVPVAKDVQKTQINQNL